MSKKQFESWNELALPIKVAGTSNNVDISMKGVQLVVKHINQLSLLHQKIRKIRLPLKCLCNGTRVLASLYIHLLTQSIPTKVERTKKVSELR